MYDTEFKTFVHAPFIYNIHGCYNAPKLWMGCKVMGDNARSGSDFQHAQGARFLVKAKQFFYFNGFKASGLHIKNRMGPSSSMVFPVHCISLATNIYRNNLTPSLFNPRFRRGRSEVG